MNMPMNDNETVHFTTTLFALIRESLNIVMRPADEMEEANEELREILRKQFPLSAKKNIIDLAVPPIEEFWGPKLTVGKIYSGLLILENFRAQPSHLFDHIFEAMQEQRVLHNRNMHGLDETEPENVSAHSGTVSECSSNQDSWSPPLQRRTTPLSSFVGAKQKCYGYQFEAKCSKQRSESHEWRSPFNEPQPSLSSTSISLSDSESSVNNQMSPDRWNDSSFDLWSRNGTGSMEPSLCSDRYQPFIDREDSPIAFPNPIHPASSPYPMSAALYDSCYHPEDPKPFDVQVLMKRNRSFKKHGSRRLSRTRPGYSHGYQPFAHMQSASFASQRHVDFQRKILRRQLPSVEALSSAQYHPVFPRPRRKIPQHGYILPRQFSMPPKYHRLLPSIPLHNSSSISREGHTRQPHSRIPTHFQFPPHFPLYGESQRSNVRFTSRHDYGSMLSAHQQRHYPAAHTSSEEMPTLNWGFKVDSNRRYISSSVPQ